VQYFIAAVAPVFAQYRGSDAIFVSAISTMSQL
jgi:hypothetical protein